MTGEPSKKRGERTYSWLELYEAKSSEAQAKVPSEKPRGRPRRTMVTKKHTVYLTAQEWEMVGKWQEILSGLMRRQVSTGETAGILARIIDERYDVLSLEHLPSRMDELVALLVEAAGSEQAGKKPSRRGAARTENGATEDLLKTEIN